MRSAARAIVLVLLACACAAPPPPAPGAGAGPSGADIPAPDPAVAALADRFWETHLRLHPEIATRLGDRRYDDRLTDLSPEGRAGRVARLRRLLQQVEAVDPRGLRRQDQVTLAMLRSTLEEGILRNEGDQDEWNVDPLRGPQVALPNLIALQTWSDEGGAAALRARFHAMAVQVAQRSAALGRGLEKGRAASRSAVEKALEQLDVLLATDLAAWPLLTNAMDAGGAAPPRLRQQLRSELLAVLREEVAPAFARFRDRLRNEVLPRSRSDDQPGLVWMPGGEEYYRRLIRMHTSLESTPQEIHDYGLEEVGRIRKEIAALGRRVFGTPDFESTRDRLMKDPAMFFATRDEVEAKARSATRRAEAALPAVFATLPRTPVVVERIPAYEEANSTMAYYRGPSADGVRPGTYFINTYDPGIRPRYNAEVLAFHEAVPGHHLQIAVAAEQGDIPEFRRHEGTTSFVEGWALYTERLCREMGLYSGDLDLFGMLGFDAWRACRLVVDTGIHAFGWSRDRAIRYMEENSLTARGNIVNEVDRYIAWPGQALAYKIGQREILRLRRKAEAALGDAFSLKAFHAVVLRDGAVTLPVLRRNVEAWLAGRTG